MASVRTVDADVVVLSIHHYLAFQNLGLTVLWTGFGCGKNYRDISMHEVSAQLGQNTCLAIPLLHAFIGSDLKSSMFWDWEKLNEMRGCVVQRWQKPWSPESPNRKNWLRTLFICVALNDWQCKCTTKTAPAARQMLFNRNLRNPECIPPTKATLYPHVKRAVFVSVFIWHGLGALARELRLSAPADYGWECNTQTVAWVPSWTHLEDACIACSLLLHCSCSKACEGRCKCYKGGLRCTPLFKCQWGWCNNEEWNRWSVIHINKDFEAVNEPIYPHLKCILGI